MLLVSPIVLTDQAYQTAAKSDFDDWNQPGWSFDELLPAIKRVRNLSNWESVLTVRPQLSKP